MSQWSVVGAPVDCIGADPASLEAFGTELSPQALRELGVLAAVDGVDRGDLDVRVVGRHRDQATGLVGGTTVHDTVRVVRDAVADLRGGGERVLLLGGCCIPLMGALAGAHDAQPGTGLVYIDGHLDLYDHTTSPTGEAADMPTAAVLGIGEPGLLEVMGAPVVTPDRLAVVGPRDPDELPTVGHLVDELGLEVFGPDRVSAAPEQVASAAVSRASGDGSFWVHLDVDVFDEAEFPATDYLMPGGLTVESGLRLLESLGGDERLVGVSVGCYNPEKDPEGRNGADLVELLAAATKRPRHGTS
jgi:arginase